VTDFNWKIQDDLKAIAGDSITFSSFERWLYSSDILHLPKFIKSMFKSVPDAVFRPASIEQLSKVVVYCNLNKIPITPRGGGSSGLFGAVPKHGGIVIDMMDLNSITSINAESEIVTAEAGLTWWELDKQLNKLGLTLNSYPSSARSATLGGWVMTSGLGIGSLKYGPLSNQVVSLEIVHADGSMKEYGKEESLKFFETEGLFGIVTRISLRVRKIPEKTRHHLLKFKDIDDLFYALQTLSKSEPVPYNMEFFDDGYCSLLKTSGYSDEEPIRGSAILLVSYDGSQQEVETGESNLKLIMQQFHAYEQAGADEHWEERFDILRVRRAVPSLFPCSVYLPLKALSQYFSRQRKLHKRIAATLGYVVANDRCNLMPMIVTDEKHPVEYTFSLHTPSSVSNLAMSLGGKPGGGIGVWNAPYRLQLLGDKFQEVRKLRANYDPENILNPGSWLNPPLLFTPAVYRTAMGIINAADALLPTSSHVSDLKGFEKELAACVQCGYCMNYCPTRLGWLSSTPRGRILATRELFLKGSYPSSFSAEYTNRLFQCTMCGRCGVDCNTDIKTRAMWLGVRQQLAKKGLVPDSLKDLVKLVDEHHNIAGRPNEQRSNWLSRVKLPYDLKGKRTAPVVYFVGCVASFFPMVQPSARAFVQILHKAGVDFTIAGGEEWCCGFPLMVAGDSESSRNLIQHNLERMKDIGAQTIVMTCPGCYQVWKKEYQEIIEVRHPFTVLHATEFMARLFEQKKLMAGELDMKVTYHDPCDLGRNAGLYDEPRYILGKIPGLEMVELENNREYCTCCGSGGDLLASNKDMALAIARRKLAEIQATGAEAAVTACPSCIRAISIVKTAEKQKLDILDITEVVLKSFTL
jgi:Fe-S oxidoreductase/FAD/FMN-containing dehydrogenase